MSLPQQFQALAREWAQHCHKVRFSSQMATYLNHPAFHQLVALGSPAIPYIIESYKVDSLPWGFVLQEITGLRMIADPNDFSPAETKRRWLDWWQEHPVGPAGTSPGPLSEVDRQKVTP